MSRRYANIALGVVGFGAVVVLLWMGGRRLPVFRERADLDRRIDSARAYVAAAQAEDTKHLLVLQELEASAAATLGDELEVVDHELRTRLNRIGEAAGLAELSVSTTGASPKGTPARSQLRDRGERALRDEVDFVEIGAIVRGEGELGQALELVRRIEAESWRKRIDAVRLTPRDNGARVTVTVRLATIFFPGSGATAPAPVEPNVAALAPVRALAAANPFRVPAPPPAAVAEAEPPGFADDDWQVSGIVLGPGGAEVWVLNRRTRETRTLGVGDAIDRFQVSAADGETVELAEGTARFRVVVGQHLGERERVSR